MTIETRTIKTYDPICLEETERYYQVAHYENWLNNYLTWFTDMVSKSDRHNLLGFRYLYSKSVAQGRAGSTLCIAHAFNNGVEFNLGWTFDLDESYYWSLFALLSETFEDRFVCADRGNGAIWVT